MDRHLPLDLGRYNPNHIDQHLYLFFSLFLPSPPTSPVSITHLPIFLSLAQLCVFSVPRPPQGALGSLDFEDMRKREEGRTKGKADGCVFRQPPKEHMWRLIEAAGQRQRQRHWHCQACEYCVNFSKGGVERQRGETIADDIQEVLFLQTLKTGNGHGTETG